MGRKEATFQLEDQSSWTVEIDDATRKALQECWASMEKGECLTLEEAEIEIEKRYSAWQENQEKLAA